MLSMTFVVSGGYRSAQGSSPELTTLHAFSSNASDGGFPVGGVVIGSHGVLYGTTDSGGAYGMGTVFALTPPASPGGTWTEAVLYNFTGGSDGGDPSASVVIGDNGTLYGTTAFLSGTVFSLAPPASPDRPWTETVLHSFLGGSNDGAQPQAGVAIGDDGTLYGTTYDGGASDLGTVFALMPPPSPGDSWREMVLHNFTGGTDDGAQPDAGVVIGSDGVLYGSTYVGGAGSPDCSAGCGTVFSLTPPTSPGGAWAENLLFSFNYGDGGLPNSLTIGSGVLYGTTYTGGTAGYGVVFSLTPPTSPRGSWTLAVLHDFAAPTAHDGEYPTGGVVIGGRGVLYGTTTSGGVRHGTAYSLTPPTSPSASWTESVLHRFTGGVDGGQPYAGLVIGHDGRLYGTTSSGGDAGGGTVFELKP
jgi:uncharacterized repeat protein (TIGR03803 family)